MKFWENFIENSQKNDEISSTKIGMKWNFISFRQKSLTIFIFFCAAMLRRSREKRKNIRKEKREKRKYPPTSVREEKSHRSLLYRVLYWRPSRCWKKLIWGAAYVRSSSDLCSLKWVGTLLDSTMMFGRKVTYVSCLQSILNVGWLARLRGALFSPWNNLILEYYFFLE